MVSLLQPFYLATTQELGKAISPMRSQGKEWIACQLIQIANECFVIGMVLLNYIGIVATRDQEPYLIICSRRAKVKLGDLLAVIIDQS